MPTKVKICGLTTEDTVVGAVDHGADAVGFVFYPPSPRYVTNRQAGYLAARLPRSVFSVGLFVDPSNETLDDILGEVDLSMLQLHGKETPERLSELKARYGRPVMKALGISEAGDLVKAEAYFDIADYMLFDAKPPQNATHPGGNAVYFDWTLLQRDPMPKQWMLAGGLTPANVSEAIAISHAPWVDVSSGVESRKAVKDIKLIEQFIEAVRVSIPAA